MLTLLFLLIFGHCLADTSLQSDFMARGKSRHNPIDPTRVPKGQKPLNLWWMWLTHHAMIQGGVVFLITGNLIFGVLEVISHWVIDYYKCESKYNPYVDQALHINMKIIYIIILEIMNRGGIR